MKYVKLFEQFISEESSLEEKANIEAAYGDLEDLFGTDKEIMNSFQDIEDNGSVSDMVDFINTNADDSVLQKYKIKSDKDVKKLAKYILGESASADLFLSKI